MAQNELRVVFWNIQNLGQDAKFLRGLLSLYLGYFLTDLAEHYDIDVFLIMEVCEGSEAHLRMITDAMNYDKNAVVWRMDFIPGSLDVPQPTGFDQMSWRGGPVSNRNEGYAVIWKKDLTKFTMVAPATKLSRGTYPNDDDTPHALGIVSRGRPFARRDRYGVEHYSTASYRQSLNGDPDSDWGCLGGFSARSRLPFLGRPIMKCWPDLNFTTVAKADMRIDRRWTRRPAWVLAQLNNGGSPENRLCPLIVFHAPSHPKLAELATRICSYARELYVADIPDGHGGWVTYAPNRVAVAGDFNCNIDDVKWGDPNADVFCNFTGDIGAGSASGAGCKRPIPKTTRTLVRLARRSTGQQIADGPSTDFYISTFDNLFFRGYYEPANELVVIDLVEALGPEGELAFPEEFEGAMDFGADYVITRGGKVERDGHGPYFLQNTKLGPVRKYFYTEGYYGGLIESWKLLKRDIRSGGFTNRRRAAEFVRFFLSDHLPLLMSFDTTRVRAAADAQEPA